MIYVVAASEDQARDAMMRRGVPADAWQLLDGPAVGMELRPGDRVIRLDRWYEHRASPDIERSIVSSLIKGRCKISERGVVTRR